VPDCFLTYAIVWGNSDGTYDNYGGDGVSSRYTQFVFPHGRVEPIGLEPVASYV